MNVSRRMNNKGFTLIELMIVVVIVGILATLSSHYYQMYTTRARLSEGLNFAASAKVAVSSYYQTMGTLPNSNAEVGLSATINSPMVQNVTISAGGVITVSYQAMLGVTAGQAIQFIPTIDASNGLQWSCNGAGTTVDDLYLPPNCR